MLSVRSRIQIRRKSTDVLVLRTSPGRRIVFAAIAAILLLGLIAGSSPADFVAPRLGGSIFYLSLLAVCIVVAGWDRQLWFHRRDGRLRQEARIRVFFVPLGSRPLLEGAPEAVVVQYLRLIRDEELGHGNPVSRRVSSYIVRRSSLFKLQIETDERTLTLEDSSDRAEIETVGKTLSEFLNIPYRFEEG